MKHRCLLLAIWALFFSSATYGQQLAHDTTETSPETEAIHSPVYNPPPQPNSEIDRVDSVWEDVEFLNTLIVAAFGLIILTLLLWRVPSEALSSEDYFRLIILGLVIVASMFFIVAGFSNEQLAPAFGILGTIAGYLLGRQSGKSNTNSG